MKILFPTDFSPAAENALRYTVKFAEEATAKLDLMNVYHLPFTEASSVPYDQINEMLDKKRDGVQTKLDQLVEKLGIGEIVDNTIPIYGIFLEHEIVDLAEEGNYDLVMMGTKGEHARFEKLLGSVTTRTMMNATCPILAVPEDAVYRDVKQIAYATDFAPTDKHAVDQLTQFAKTLEANLHFVHIEKRKDVLGGDSEINIDQYPQPFTDFTLLKSESVMTGLDQFIQEKQIDILSLFIPRRRLWERLFHSSFTQKMTFHTKIPLLVFRE